MRLILPAPGGPLPDPDPGRELAARLRDVDRLYPASPFRRAFRAALCRHYGDVIGEHRELTMLLAEAGDFHGLSGREVDRLVMPLATFAATRGRRRN